TRTTHLDEIIGIVYLQHTDAKIIQDETIFLLTMDANNYLELEYIREVSKLSSYTKYISYMIFSLSLCVTLPLDLYVSSLPSIAIALRTNQHLVELTIVYFTLGLAGGQIFYGPYSDFVGRRKSILIGFLVALGGSFICIISNNIFFIIVGR